MTPTEQEIEFFKKAKPIQELWEPKFGDWVATIYFHDILLVVGTKGDYIDHVPLKQDDYGSGVHTGLRKNVIFIPRQGQLQAMLEERGCDIKTYTLVLDQSEYKTKASVWPKTGDVIDTFGPTPSIALGRALLEVMDKERIEDMDKWIGEDIEAEIKRQFPNG